MTGQTLGMALKAAEIQAEISSFCQNSRPNLALATVMAHIAPSSFGRTTWPRRAPRVGLTTFLQISNEPAALARGLLYTPTRRKS